MMSHTPREFKSKYPRGGFKGKNKKPRSGEAPTSFAKTIIDIARDLKVDIDYSKFKTAPDSKFSSLMPYNISHVREFFNKAITTNVSSVIDTTSNIGADTVNFARMYPDAKIRAIEYNSKTFAFLKSNIEAFGLQKTVTPIHADAVKYISAMLDSVDLIYCDPPWGGPRYWENKELSLKLSNLDIADFVDQCLSRARVVVVKVPSNFAFEKFKARLIKYKIVRAGIPRKTTDGGKGEFVYYLVAVYANA